MRNLAGHAGVAHRITWVGMLQGDVKWGALRTSDAFVLPSHQENFGIAVVEALACGLPVLISDKVNIWREVAADGAGFVAPDTIAGTAHNLRRWFALDDIERTKMRTQAAATFCARFTIDAHTQRLLGVLEADAADATAAMPRPSVG